MVQLLDRLLTFSASLRLAIGVIVALAVYLAAGTVYESRYGMRAAQVMVYQSPAFIAVLSLLALNVLSAALVRIPWKRHQMGFLITHLGIEVLLVGCLIGAYRGFEGQLRLRPGESAGAIDLSSEQIIVIPAGQRESATALGIDPFAVAEYPSLGRFLLKDAWTGARPAARGERKIGTAEGVAVGVLEWAPAVRAVDGYEPSAGGLPAAQVRVAGTVPNGAKVDQTVWITPGSPAGLFGGMIRLRFATPADADLTPARGELVLSRGDAGYLATVIGVNGPKDTTPVQVGTPIPSWMGLNSTVLQFIPEARPVRTVTPLNVSADRIDSAVAAVRVAAAVGPDRIETWLLRGDAPTRVSIGGREIELAYAFARAQVPWTVTLESASPPKTGDRAAPFEARIGIQSPDGKATHTVSPNHPAKAAAGTTIYVAAVERVDGRPVAFFRVRYDPGWVVKYAGSGLVVLGTVLMFVIRKPKVAVESVANTPHRRGVPEPSAGGPKAARPAGLTGVITLLVLVLGAVAPEAGAQTDVTALRSVPVFHADRVKPIDTMARELVRFVHGRETSDALATMLRWTADPAAAADAPVLLVENLDLRRRLGLPAGVKHISRNSLTQNTQASAWLQEIAQREVAAEEAGADARLNKEETAGLELRRRVAALDAITTGAMYRIEPPASAEGEWRSPTPNGPLGREWSLLIASIAQNRPIPGADQLPRLAAAAADASLRREVSYNRLHPFRWTGLVYAAGVILLTAGAWSARGGVSRAGLVVTTLALLMHTAAFVWRCTITGWAPVTNIYETVIWVGGVSALLGLILHATGGPAAAGIGGAVVATLGCVVGDVMPAEYGRSIQSLAAPLRSNLWLTVHVLTVVSSYAAFAMATVLANVALWRMAGRPRPAERGGMADAVSPGDLGAPGASCDLGESVAAGQHRAPAVSSNLHGSIYRCIQIGVVLIAAGTVLGALWADVSWGRFWGWDPKEVWALVVLLSYLALLHGKAAGYVRGFGLAVGSVVCFMTVLMSWYGVNFILGTGLHSYGFGAGGLEYVSAFVAAQLGFVAWAAWRVRSHQTELIEHEETNKRRMQESGNPAVDPSCVTTD